MARLSKAQAKAHAEAVELLTQDVLTFDQKLFVIEHWQESATHVNTAAGAFFTPYGLASDAAIDVGKSRSVVDLCAGIGTLSLAVQRHHLWDSETPRLVCVEINEEYAAVGRKIVPEAEWIVTSVFDLPDTLGVFDVAISNPPFGNVNRGGGGGLNYAGQHFEYHVIDVASRLARRGMFIIPQASAGFEYSGKPYYSRSESTKYAGFHKQTGVALEPGCGIDTSVYAGDWHLVSPAVEVALADFPKAATAEVLDDAPALFEVA